MDVDSNLKGKSDDTATRQDQNVSDSKDSTVNPDSQAKSEETPIGNSKYPKFGKSSINIVGWIDRGLATYIDKEKALEYLRISAPIAEAQDNQELDSATKVVKDFVNPTLYDGNSEEESVLLRPLTDEETSSAQTRGNLVVVEVEIVEYIQQ